MARDHHNATQGSYPRIPHLVRPPPTLDATVGTSNGDPESKIDILFYTQVQSWGRTSFGAEGCPEAGTKRFLRLRGTRHHAVPAAGGEESVSVGASDFRVNIVVPPRSLI